MYIKGGFVSLSATESFGIDKVHLFTDLYSIDSVTPWNIRPTTKKAGEDKAAENVLFTANGQNVYGGAAYINKPGYTAELKYGKLHVQFNPSKHYHDYHLTADQDKIATVLKSIETDLKETMSTETDLFSMSISRLDLTAQAVMSKTCPHYDQVINGSKVLRRAPKTEYPHGFLMGNKTRQVVTYDKGLKDLKDKGYKDIQPSELLRVETRNLNASAMKMHTPFSNIMDLLSADQDKYNYAYSKCLHANLNIEQQTINFMELSALTDLLRTTKMTHSRQWLYMAIAVLSNGSKLPTAAQFERAILPLINEGIIDRTSAWRSVKNYQKLTQETRFLSTRLYQESETNSIELHKEFIDKLILPYKTA